MREPLLQALAQRQVLVQQLRVVAIRVPARPPRLVESETEPERVNLLAHSYSFSDFDFALAGSRFAPVFFGAAPARRGRFGASPSAATATTFSGRSDTCTVRCAVRFRTRNARPIGAGRTRFCDGP